MLLKQENVNEASRGLKAVFFEAAEGGTLVADKIATRVNSTNNEESWNWFDNNAQMRELVGEITIENIKQNSYSIKNKEYTATVGVPQAAIENDTLGVYKPLMASMGQGAKEHDDETLAELLCAGFSKPCYDGAAFFSASHKYAGNKTPWSNLITKKLSAASFETARAMIKRMKKANGSSCKNGKKLALVVSAKNESTARQILNAEIINSTTNVNKGTAELIVWPDLDTVNEDAWFILELGQSIKPLIIQDNHKIELTAIDRLDADHVVKHHEFLYQAYKRTGYGYGLPQYAVGSTGATA